MQNATPFHRYGNPKTGDPLGILEERNRRTLTHLANDRFVMALLRYGARNGLPNISADQCRANLIDMEARG